MNRIARSIAVATLLGFAATSVVAANPPTAAPDPQEQNIDQLFVQLDQNRDGFIDATEATNHKGLASAFPRIARSGRLDRQQFVAWYKVYDMAPAQE